MKFKPLFVSVLFLLIGSSLAAQTCKTDPNNCTPSDLCKQATESFDNQRYWIADEKNPYLVLARKFGLDCNALEAATDCTKDASKCTISDLCQAATTSKGQNMIWDLQRPSHIKLAKDFGLKCEVAQSIQISKTCSDDVKLCETNVLCSRGTRVTEGEIKWFLKGRFVKYVTEAKRRGLACGIQEWQSERVLREKPVSILKQCKANLKECSDSSLCEIASYRSVKSMFKHQFWKVEGNYKPFRKEAQSRGLSCGVGEPISEASSVVQENIPSSKAMLLLEKVPVKDLEGIDVFRLMQHRKCPAQRPFHDCFIEKNLAFSKGETSPFEKYYVGYFWDNREWQGLQFADDLYEAYFFEGDFFPVPTCRQIISDAQWNDWYICRNDDKYRALEGKSGNSGHWTTVEEILPDGARKENRKMQGLWEYVWADGDKYVGEYKDGKNHGWGNLRQRNGHEYTGNWVSDEISGIGRMVQPNGDTYEGNFQRGNRQGKGFVVYANGDIYNGDFDQDQRHGQGEFTSEDGYKYTGSWSRGQIVGEGKAIYPDGTIYSGSFSADLPNGTGKITYPSGDVYKGQFSAGNIHGKGLATYPNGVTYEGEFRDNRYHGKGIMTHTDGSRYDGDWQDGERYGYGIAMYPNGATYQGAFQNGKRQGKGQLTMPDGFTHDGYWQEGEMTGAGVATYSNGAVYTGLFSNGKRHGKGTMRYANGTKESGIWINGAFANK